MLCKIDKESNFHVVSYHSRQFLHHELQYTGFLMDILAAADSMEHFN